MIYATVGTMFLDFPRLIHALDAIAESTGERVLVQTGLCTTIPAHCEHFDFKSREDVVALQRDARVIVCHAGIGTVVEALRSRRPVAVVPRRLEFKEHLTNHQFDLAEMVERRGWARMILDIDELADACANPPAVPERYEPATHRLVEAIRESVERAAARG
jgi:UDP-N-acetylglucosamine transferase subunit ALG13